jgi:hypothetical protein
VLRRLSLKNQTILGLKKKLADGLRGPLSLSEYKVLTDIRDSALKSVFSGEYRELPPKEQEEILGLQTQIVSNIGETIG